MRKLLLIPFLFLLIPYLGIAQNQYGDLQGSVSSNNEIVIGANAGIAELQKGAATNAEGFFQIKDIPAGTYTLEYRRLGLKSIQPLLRFSPEKSWKWI